MDPILPTTAETVPPPTELNAPGELSAQPFEPDQDLLLELCPGIREAAKTLEDFIRASSPGLIEDDPVAQTSEHSKPRRKPQDDPNILRLSRTALREQQHIYGPHFRQVARTGARYAGSFEDPAEGMRVTRTILDETVGTILDEVWMTGAVPVIPLFKKLHDVSRTVSDQVVATQGDYNRRYVLLKALAADYTVDVNEKPDTFVSPVDWPAGRMFMYVSTFNKSPIWDELVQELEAGAFDAAIARELLQFADGNTQLDTDAAKLRQLTTFLRTFLGTDEQDAALHQRMVDCLVIWPADQLEVVATGRQKLGHSLVANKKSSHFQLKEKSKMIDDTEDLRGAFESAAGALALLYLRRVETTPKNRVKLIQKRNEIKRKHQGGPAPESPNGKRRRKGNKLPQETGPEASREPRTLITCNLNDDTTLEGVEGFINGFMEATNPGDTGLRTDLDKMVEFLARRDLPRAHRRGIKAIRTVKVEFNDTRWDLFEFKPREAAGLSLKTNHAKESRIYFIKLPDGEFGIVGIELRAKQEEFLRGIGIKVKNSKQQSAPREH